jgi:hypothetical protein
MYSKHGTATDEVIKEQVKLLEQQVSAKNFDTKTGMYFAQKNEVINPKINFNLLPFPVQC